ncbi:MAG: OmpA family protein [Phycisphaeraceae bacterium]|nr:OmpA family protein [Phycisphaeraceae bacterium]
MKSWTKMVVTAMAALVLAGCVSQQQMDEMRALYRKSQDQVENLKAQLNEAEARIAALQEQGRSTDPKMLSELEKALAERDRALAALRDAEESLRQLGKRPGPMLDPTTDAALMELAQAYPDLMSYDPERGMVRFHSDLTFALGSVEVRPQAAASLRKLAEILRSASASGYEVKIVGHTDNVPVSRAETKAKHPTNWHLSVHRSIAVKDVLAGDGVPQQRILVCGAGEFRPIVPNQKGGAEPNRRVEIYLSPMSSIAPAGPSSSVPAAGPSVRSAPVSEPPVSKPGAGPGTLPPLPDLSK